jgi:hypothetical protein
MMATTTRSSISVNPDSFRNLNLSTCEILPFVYIFPIVINFGCGLLLEWRVTSKRPQIPGHSRNPKTGTWRSRKKVSIYSGLTTLSATTATLGNLTQGNLEGLLYVKNLDRSNKICYRRSAASSAKLVLLESRPAAERRGHQGSSFSFLRRS